VSDFAAQRLGAEPEDPLALLVGHMALAASMAAFERWVTHPEDDPQERRPAGAAARVLPPSRHRVRRELNSRQFS
jgi:hypothetical protein